MADETLFSFFKALPTPEDLERWEEEHARMGAAIAELSEKRKQLGELIRVAAAIHGGKEAARRGVGNANVGRARARGTWMAAIAEIVKAHPEGIPYDDIRKALPEPYASMIAKDINHRSFYGAMRRLESRGDAKRYNGHLFTPEGFAAYQKRVAAGDIPDVAGRDPRRGSPVSEALKEFLGENPRSTPAAIKAHLVKFEQFRGSLVRNSSAFYNIIKRLKDREEIVHHEDEGTYSLVDNGNEAPNGEAAGASDAGRAGTLPFENVVGFPRPR